MSMLVSHVILVIIILVTHVLSVLQSETSLSGIQKTRAMAAASVRPYIKHVR